MKCEIPEVTKNCRYLSINMLPPPMVDNAIAHCDWLTYNTINGFDELCPSPKVTTIVFSSSSLV